VELKKIISRSISSEEKEETNKLYISKKLIAKINAQNKGEIYFVAEELCQYKCDNLNAVSNPMIACVNVCPIWLVKNKAL
jgi:hypothetical protein